MAVAGSCQHMTRPPRDARARRTGCPTVLMTPDEARMQLGRSALACLQSASCGPHELWAMLRGLPVRGVTLPDHRLAFAHKRVLDDIEAAGYGDVIDDELEGLASATGLDEGELRDISAIAATFECELDDQGMTG